MRHANLVRFCMGSKWVMTTQVHCFRRTLRCNTSKATRMLTAATRVASSVERLGCSVGPNGRPSSISYSLTNLAKCHWPTQWQWRDRVWSKYSAVSNTAMIMEVAMCWNLESRLSQAAEFGAESAEGVGLAKRPALLHESRPLICVASSLLLTTPPFSRMTARVRQHTIAPQSCLASN